MDWRLDEGLDQLRKQWLEAHPGATVYTIGDASHSTDPDVSQHAPDDGGSAPGDTRGEVDAIDIMPGKGVTENDLDQLFSDLIKSRDERILYVIHGRQIVSSVVKPWQVRRYKGAYHGHVHVSVNDKFEANRTVWTVGDSKKYAPRFELVGTVPTLRLGMEDDAFAGYKAIARVQILANYVDSTRPDLDVDGVYGAKTAAKIRAIMKTGDGKTIGLAEYRRLFGIYA